MVYEIDFELPIYGGEHVLRFSPSVALQGKSINFFKGSYDALFPILEEQLTRLKKAGERVKVYVNGDFVDFSRSPVLREFSKIQKYVIDFSVSDIYQVIL